MVYSFAVTDVKNRSLALKKARRTIARRNKDPKAYKGAERILKGLKKENSYYIATTNLKKKIKRRKR